MYESKLLHWNRMYMCVSIVNYKQEICGENKTMDADCNCTGNYCNNGIF